MKKKIIHIDMDDTICHFKKHFFKCRNTHPSFIYPQSRPGFFAELEPIDGAKEAIAKLQEHFDVWILTRPSVLNPHCYTDKRLWLEEHYGLDFCNKLILCPDKGLIKGDYLIDDVLWKDFEGHQVHFGTINFDTWDKVVDYIYERETTTLYRPVNQHELKLIQEDYYSNSFPPRLPEQPFFYPVTNKAYAAQIAKDWNVPAYGHGYVTEFRVITDYLSHFDIQTVGGAEHTEYWVPSHQLTEFNAFIIDKIKVVAEF